MPYIPSLDILYTGRWLVSGDPKVDFPEQGGAVVDQHAVLDSHQVHPFTAQCFADLPLAAFHLTRWRESSSATLRVAEYDCVPSGRRPAKLANAVRENLCGSALAAATRETARFFPAFAGAVCRSSTTESLGASTTATVWFDPTAIAGSTTACRDPSTWLLGRRSYKTLFPVSAARVAHRCCRWPPAGSRSG
jgi:hypothetical protein